jgi:hypothetical protein
VKGSSLVLYFEPPPPGAPPLTLVLSGREAVSGRGLIEVEGGGLDISGGALRLPDFPSAQLPAFLIAVHGGDLRLYHCRLDGPQQHVPDEFRALVSLQGSGQAGAGPPAQRGGGARAASFNESVLTCGGAVVRVEGAGARLEVRRSLVVAGSHVLRLALGPGGKERAGVQCVLKHTTVAARGAVVLLEDAPPADPLREPAVVQTRDCAFLNPFPGPRLGKPNPAGLLVYQADALAQGLLIWQSDADGYDTRLHFCAAPVGSVPVKPQGLEVWVRLWGSPGVQGARTLRLTRPLSAGRWQLGQLAVPGAQGADLNRLGLGKGR